MSNPYEANIKRSGEATACYNGMCIGAVFANMIVESKIMTILQIEEVIQGRL